MSQQPKSRKTPREPRPFTGGEPLERWSKTLADYKPLDCAIVHIGSRWLVVFRGRYFPEPYLTRTEAIRALASLDRIELEAHQSGVRG